MIIPIDAKFANDTKNTETNQVQASKKSQEQQMPPLHINGPQKFDKASLFSHYLFNELENQVKFLLTH